LKATKPDDATYTKSSDYRPTIPSNNNKQLLRFGKKMKYIIWTSLLVTFTARCGTEYKSSILGIPSIPIPNSPTPFPELALARGVEQTGIAKLLVLVHSNGKVVSTGHYYGKVERDESFILWFRFQPKDDIRKRWEAADEKLKAKSAQRTD
jgi:hypothetical protein